MKLIDANKLRKDFLDLPNCYNGYSDTYDKSLIIEVVDEQPTIEAIPIEWLKKYIDKLNSELSHDEIDDPSDIWAVVTLETLLEDWEEHDVEAQ